MPSGMFTSSSSNAELVDGPPIEDVVTSFDDGLHCLRGKIPSGVVFAVGQVIDATGKETYAEGGTGKFVTQGAGEMIQSALFRAGVSVVNRRDPQISMIEANWGIRDIRRQVPVNFFVSGSINSLDFIPGGGFSAQVAGIGPRYRQNRILIALDLTLTDAYTGRIVASIPLQKQIFTKEYGASANTFFGNTLVQFEAGGMEREALHFALRQMLSLATIELLGQLMKPEVYQPCRDRIEGSGTRSPGIELIDEDALDAALLNVAALQTDEAPALAVAVSQPDDVADAAAVGQSVQVAAAAPAVPVAQTQGAPEMPPEAVQLGRLASVAATEAIRAARDSESATDRAEALKTAAQALQRSNDALRLLQKAAELGFGGDEGEVAAVVVQQSLQAAQKAGTTAAARTGAPQQPQAPQEVRPPTATGRPETEIKPSSAPAPANPPRRNPGGR
jgi:curli biogenesis system outer membrane secretion channel CsgG